MLDSTHRAWASTEKRTPRMYDAGLPLKKQRTVTRTNSDRDHDRSRDALRIRILHEVDHMRPRDLSREQRDSGQPMFAAIITIATILRTHPFSALNRI